MTGYELSRTWFDFCFKNPEKITPLHTALYLFAVEHCNRLGWKEKFGLPTEMAKEAIGVKNWHTYIKAFNDLVDWGFFILIEKSKNQYSSNIIALSKIDEALDEALDEAIAKHISKQPQSTYQSTDSIIKLITNNIKTINENFKEFEHFVLSLGKPKIKNEFDLSFIEPQYELCFRRWLKYKKEIKDFYKTQDSIQQAYKNLIKLSNNTPQIAEIIVDNSIGSGYKGLFSIKDEQKSYSPHQPAPR